MDVQDWAKLLSAGGTCGILGLIVWYLLTRMIPSLTQAYKDSLDKVLDDAAKARKQSSDDLERDRKEHREQLAALHGQFHDRDKLLIDQLQRMSDGKRESR